MGRESHSIKELAYIMVNRSFQMEGLTLTICCDRNFQVIDITTVKEANMI